MASDGDIGAKPANGPTEAERIASAMSSIFAQSQCTGGLTAKTRSWSSQSSQHIDNSAKTPVSRPRTDIDSLVNTKINAKITEAASSEENDDDGHVYELAYLKAMVRKRPPSAKSKSKLKNPKAPMEETEEEEKARMAFARKVYNRNLRTLVSCLSNSRQISKRGKNKSSRRTLWKVKLNSFGEVLSVVKTSVSRCKPEPCCFIMIVKGNGTPPVIGTFEALTPTQQNVARCLKTDILKIANATEIAHTTPGRGKCETVDRIVEEHLKGFRERYGDLPPSRTAIAQRNESLQKAKKAKEVQEKVKECEKVLNETPTFEEFLQQMKYGNE